MKNISLIYANENDKERIIQYCHSDSPTAINLEISKDVYEQIQAMPMAQVKRLIEQILLSPNSIQNADKKPFTSTNNF